MEGLFSNSGSNPYLISHHDPLTNLWPVNSAVEVSVFETVY